MSNNELDVFSRLLGNLSYAAVRELGLSDADNAIIEKMYYSINGPKKKST